jgi:hypothetical protein
MTVWWGNLNVFMPAACRGATGVGSLRSPPRNLATCIVFTLRAQMLLRA